MTTPSFLPIITNNYSKFPTTSTNRHPETETTKDFQLALDQIKARMDTVMADTLFGNSESSNAEQGMNMLSQAMNLNVLTTLSRLTSQGNQPSSLLHTSGEITTKSTTTQAVNALERAIIATQGPARDTKTMHNNIGILSEFFESGKQAEAIGYDQHGGTSYGTFQISSRQGTLHQFLDFLKKHAPEWATRLQNAGPANTGGIHGKMPEEWRMIASENPKKFKDLQHQFITETQYLPALENILQSSEIERDIFSGPLQEVLFSTAVQHGSTGAAKIFKQAMRIIDSAKPNDKASQLLEQVYAIRKKQFASSPSQVRAAVQGRLDQEKRMAQSLIENTFA